MGSLAYADDTSEPARVAAVLVVTVVLVASVLGGVLTIIGQPAAPGTTPGTSRSNQIHDDVETSFGTIAVDSVRQVDGVTHRALNGSTHGVNGLVDSAHAKIQVTLTFTNSHDEPLFYTADQFRLRVRRNGQTSYETVSGGDLPDATVLPGAGISGHLDFTVPRADAGLSLEFKDRARDHPIVIALGTTAFQPRAPGAHDH